MRRANIAWFIAALLCATQLTLGDPAESAYRQYTESQSDSAQEQGFWPMHPTQCQPYRGISRCMFQKCLCFSSCNIVQAGMFIGFDTARVRECEGQYVTCEIEKRGGNR